MKTVKYMGQTFSVPDEAKWIAADVRDGRVFVFINPPQLSNNIWWGEDGECVGCVATNYPCEAC